MILFVDEGASREAARPARGRAESSGLVVGGAEHAERGVAADAVVKRFDVLDDLAGQLAAGRPRLAVHELFLERREEALGDGVIEAVARGAHRAGDAGVAG